MAIDTRNKRASVVDATLPWHSDLPLADGSIGTEDRQHLVGDYPGFVVIPSGDLDTRIKRASSVDSSLPWHSDLPLPDASIIRSDRQQTVGDYAGIGAVLPSALGSGMYILRRARIPWGW